MQWFLKALSHQLDMQCGGQSEQTPQCPVPERPVLAADQVRARRGRAADHYALRLTWK